MLCTLEGHTRLWPVDHSHPTCLSVQQVTVRDLSSDLLSNVIDSAVLAGGNALQISSVTLSLSPSASTAALNAARRAAVKDAQETAQLLASAAGVVLGGPQRIEDSNSTPATPLPTAAAGQSGIFL